MSIILLRGSLVFENYSQTQIKLTVSDNGFESVYYFDKKLTRVQIPNDASVGEQIVSISGPISSFINNFNFYYNEVLAPVTTSIIEFTNILNGWFYTDGPEISINGGANLTPLGTLNLIEGSNITITAVEDISNNKVDITISSTGGGGGLPPDGTYGDIVVTGSGTVWTTTDDTSNQQVAVYEDGFIRGTRPALNFFDDGGAVSVTVTDDVVNNRVDIGISTSIPTPATVYLVAHDENTQTAATRDTGYPMSIDWIDESNDITINAHTQITFNQDGVYNIQFSAQFTNNDTQFHDVDVWFKKNTSNIPWTNSRFTITGTHGGDSGHHIAAWNYMATFNTGDFVEIYWETDDTQVVIEKIPAANDAPDTPSIILTVDKL